MTQILIRNLSNETIRRLEDRAARHGRRLEGEARLILTRAAGVSFDEAQKLARQWHERLAGRKLPDSGQLIYLLAPALQIAIATNRTVCDSLYLALAMELGGTVVTADERWANALQGSPFARFVRRLNKH
jgi:plasmid stability protein